MSTRLERILYMDALINDSRYPSVKRFIEVNYQYIISLEEAINMMLNKVKEKLTGFIEGILFADNCDVVMTEKLTDDYLKKRWWPIDAPPPGTPPSPCS